MAGIARLGLARVGDAVVGSVGLGSTYLFCPPQRRQIQNLAGNALRYSYQVSLTVYKSGGVWTATETPDPTTLAAAEWPLPGEICDRPQIVSAARGVELLNALADINANIDVAYGYTLATCTPIGA